MRILEAFGEPISYGGQESFVMSVLDNMDRTGLKIDLLSPYYCDNINIVSKVRHYGGEVYALGCDFRPGRSRNNTVEPIRAFLRSHTYDAIHIHSGSNSMLAIFARLAAGDGIPEIIVHSHCTGKRGPKHYFSKALTTRSLRKYPTAYCACSKEAAEWRFPYEVLGKTEIVNNGIDIEKFRFSTATREIMRESLGIGDDTVLVGCIGRLAYQKNQSFLLDVMETVKKKQASATEDPENSIPQNDFKLILVGDGEDRAALEHKAEHLGISGDVIFTGAVDNVQDYLQAIDVAVMPSRYEGLAIAAIEAQASGLEVIVSDAIPRAAACTDNIVFLPSGDKEEWAKAVMKPHTRHPEQADMTEDSGYSITDTAITVRNIYAPEGTRL